MRVVEQGLGGDAADVEAGSTQSRVLLNANRLKQKNDFFAFK